MIDGTNNVVSGTALQPSVMLVKYEQIRKNGAAVESLHNGVFLGAATKAA
jgi:hypothetical protein